ncbi:MAG TPA: ATP-dependent DNA helicase RecG, partial [Verrucomicrobiae bacterium]|nr:ATP-dependent DNA helicase RecG [Verrucomicrobiae bacterium]
MDLDAPLRFVKGIGPARAEALVEEGYETAFDLLLHFPFRYDDRSRFATIASLQAGSGRVTITARVLSSSLFTTRRRGMRIVKALVDDGTGSLECLWFNQPFIKKHLVAGAEIILHGAVTRAADRKGALQMQGPEWELVTHGAGDEIHTGRIVPVHRRLPDLSPKTLRRLIHTLLESLSPDLADPLPAALRERLDLSPRAEAIRDIHFPPPGSDLFDLAARRTPAHRRMIFEEFFVLQLALALRRLKVHRETRSGSYEMTSEIRKRLASILPFHLTVAQRRVLAEIVADLKTPHPMSRLLQGDVGSGKTIVALLAMLFAVENGLQAALMAPTEILAEQHHRVIERLLHGKGYRSILLTGATRRAAGKPILAGISGGFWQIVVGTHAIIQEGVNFQRLGLVVVDEQHRFGVLQRAALREKGSSPDVLIMTATPIPRSLCMTVYGDLDLSVIDELPPGRRPVKTLRRKEDAREKIYEFVRKEIRQGRQAYVVLPLVAESETIAGVKAAVKMAAELTRSMSDTSVGLVHGQLKSDERDSVMKRFASGEIELLVATTVIEVGIDVPNATVMVIENAERFGLSQLHQLRGRVGRGAHASYCILLESDEVTPEAEMRLQTIAATEDGFAIAERDLEIRGPGEMTGTRQTGLPELRIASLLRDREILELARLEAARLVEGMEGRELEGRTGENAPLIRHAMR